MKKFVLPLVSILFFFNAAFCNNPTDMSAEIKYILLNPDVRHAIREGVTTAQIKHPILANASSDRVHGGYRIFQLFFREAVVGDDPHVYIRVKFTLKGRLITNVSRSIVESSGVEEHFKGRTLHADPFISAILSSSFDKTLQSAVKKYGSAEGLILYDNQFFDLPEELKRKGATKGLFYAIGHENIAKCDKLMIIKLGVKVDVHVPGVEVIDAQFDLRETASVFGHKPLMQALTKMHDTFVKGHFSLEPLTLTKFHLLGFGRIFGESYMRYLKENPSPNPADVAKHLFDLLEIDEDARDLANSVLGRRFINDLLGLKKPSVGQIARLAARQLKRTLKK